MPTTTERYEPGIYIAHWIGNVTLEDVFEARDAINIYAAEDNRLRYIVVIDGTQTKRVPTDIRILLKTTNPGSIAILVYHSPIGGTIVGSMFNQFSPFKAEFYNDFETVLERAYHLLAEEQGSSDRA
ncbi:MAG: hypothetical protein AAF787_06560 [Chloroflexota bacterium]